MHNSYELVIFEHDQDVLVGVSAEDTDSLEHKANRAWQGREELTSLCIVSERAREMIQEGGPLDLRMYRAITSKGILHEQNDHPDGHSYVRTQEEKDADHWVQGVSLPDAQEALTEMVPDTADLSFLAFERMGTKHVIYTEAARERIK